MKLTENLYYYPEKGMLTCNTYIIKDAITVIVDVGSRQFLPQLIRDMQKDGIEPKDINVIANTHLHGDHCWANEIFKKLSQARILLHPVQSKFYEVSVVHTSRFFGFEPVNFQADGNFDANKLAPDTRVQLIPSPGHSPDSVCIYSPGDKFLISGDVIFCENTGRVDLPGGSADQLRKSINSLAQLDVEYLLPGHMGIVTGTRKVKNNFDMVKKYILESL